MTQQEFKDAIKASFTAAASATSMEAGQNAVANGIANAVNEYVTFLTTGILTETNACAVVTLNKLHLDAVMAETDPAIGHAIYGIAYKDETGNYNFNHTPRVG